MFKSSFEKWWEQEKLRPPYTNPQAIARAAWLAAMDFCLEHYLKESERCSSIKT